MVAIKASDADAFVTRPDAKQPIVLVFGPDAGLVRERAEILVRNAVDDPDDPFSLVRIDGDDLASDPMRLVDEANTIPLFGGRRAVWVKATGRNIVPAVEAAIAASSPECRVVIEAGDLRKNAPLRVLIERAKTAAAVACYADSERDTLRLIDEEMRAANLAIAPDARAVLAPLLGADRKASRSEIQKIALYAHGRGTVTLEDVLAVVADASAIALDGLIDAVFAGRTGEADTLFTKARAAGAAPGAIVSAALRQIAVLHKLALAVEEGGTPESAIDTARPPLHFRRKPLVEAALRFWSPAQLLRTMTQLSETLLETRKQPLLAEAIAQRALTSIAYNARRKD